jgi:hypothetical protein
LSINVGNAGARDKIVTYIDKAGCKGTRDKIKAPYDFIARVPEISRGLGVLLDMARGLMLSHIMQAVLIVSTGYSGDGVVHTDAQPLGHHN